jgi:phenylalanine-4-hydroxylase
MSVTVRVHEILAEFSRHLQMRAFGRSLSRPFSIRYNPYTESVEIINSLNELNQLSKSIKADMDVLVNAMEHISNRG